MFEFGSVDDRICTDSRKVIAVERDIENAVERAFAFERLNPFAKALGERYAPSANAHQIEILGTFIFLDDLRRKPPKSTLHPDGIHDSRLFDQMYFVNHSNANVTKGSSKFKVTRSKFV